MGGMGGMNMAGMGLGMGGSSITSPTSGSASLPNVSGHGMSQQSPSSAGPPQTSSMSNSGLPPGFPNLTPQQMQQLAQMNPQMKAMQIQRIMQAQQQMANSNMQGMGGGMGGGMGMGGMSPAQLQMLQRQQQTVPARIESAGDYRWDPSANSLEGEHQDGDTPETADDGQHNERRPRSRCVLQAATARLTAEVGGAAATVRRHSAHEEDYQGEYAPLVLVRPPLASHVTPTDIVALMLRSTSPPSQSSQQPLDSRTCR
ncbi:hypothetical protein L227DRAFT_582198, partial [Lentinus tigrinus ALCF2SS1-6]